MRPIVRIFLLVVLVAVAAISLQPTAFVLAQDAEATAAPEGNVETSSLTFEEMGTSTEFVLRTIFDSADYTFGLPADWELSEGTSVQLHLTVFNNSVTNGSTSTLPEDQSGILLEVSFNGLFITAIPISAVGDMTVNVDIPPQALALARRDGRHELSIILDEEDCLSDDETSVAIRNDSVFGFPHQIGILPTDLRLLPRPIFQQSFIDDEALVVIPDAPTEAELRAALTVIAGFAKTTGGRLALQLLPLSELTPELQSSYHIILTGKLASMPLLQSVPLPEAMSATGVNALQGDTDDGILAMAVSPWNAARVLLIVTGASDAGVVKAAQTLSSGDVRTSASSDFALIADVQPDRIYDVPPPPDSTLADLGYRTQILNSFGFNFAEYTFYIPPGQQLADGAYFDLTFSHSGLLDYDLSSLNLLLNDEPIGSIRLSDETTNPNTVHIDLPASASRTGINVLSVNALLRPRSVCIDPRSQSVWLSVLASSKLHLPYTAAQARTTQIYDLSKYPSPLSWNPSLNQVAFVVPSGSPDAWKAAASLAFDLGKRSRGALIDLTAVFADNVSDDVRQNYNLVVVGRPSALSLLAELTAVMPAPFTSDTEFAVEDRLPFVYRLRQDASLGYLELFASPWNPNLVVLTVLGSTDEGVQWAADALITPTTRSTLAGNFAAIEGQHAFAFMTQDAAANVVAPIAVTEEPSLDLEAFLVTPEATAEAASPVTPFAPSPRAERPAWVLPAVGVITVIMIVIVLSVAIFSSIKRVRSSAGSRASRR